MKDLWITVGALFAPALLGFASLISDFIRNIGGRKEP
jgi:hypothetical protein